MILFLSSSTGLASVAFFDEGRVVWSGEKEAPRSASSAICSMIDESRIPLESVTSFGADLGPGSFMGVKVAVTLAKTWAQFSGASAFGLSSFDICDDPVDVLPARKGQGYFRRGSEVFMADWDGVGPTGQPRAVNALRSLDSLEFQDPIHLEPLYGALPNISVSKRPVIMGEGK